MFEACDQRYSSTFDDRVGIWRVYSLVMLIGG